MMFQCQYSINPSTRYFMYTYVEIYNDIYRLGQNLYLYSVF